MKQLGLAFHLYAVDWGYWPKVAAGVPFGAADWITVPPGVAAGPPVSCSPNSCAVARYANPSDLPYRKSVYACPSERRNGPYLLSYQMNAWFQYLPCLDPSSCPPLFLRENGVARPAGTYLLLEEMEGGLENDGGVSPWVDRVTARHRGGCNVLYADGHVKWIAKATVDSDFILDRGFRFDSYTGDATAY